MDVRIEPMTAADVPQVAELEKACFSDPWPESILSHELENELDGAFNEDYCKWCYHDGTFQYESKEQLIDFCVEHMATETWPKEQVRAHMEAVVPLLKHWK